MDRYFSNLALSLAQSYGRHKNICDGLFSNRQVEIKRKVTLSQPTRADMFLQPLMAGALVFAAFAPAHQLLPGGRDLIAGIIVDCTTGYGIESAGKILQFHVSGRGNVSPDRDPELIAIIRATGRWIRIVKPEALVRQRFYLDSIWWGQGEEVTPHLQTVHEALWQDRKVRLSYHVGPVLMIDQVVDPYGLVAKAGIWYLVCAQQGSVRVHRVAHLVDAQLTTETFTHPASFELASFWGEWCQEQEANAGVYLVHLRAAPRFVAALPGYFGDRIRTQIAQAGPPDPDGWLPLTVAFESLEAARNRLLSFGGGVEVINPLALRKSMLDFATQTVAMYQHERLG